MDLPVSDPGPVKESGPFFYCDHCDAELVHKIAQLLLPGLATACVDNTTGLFRGPASVAVDLRKEMVDYLTQRSEMFVAETVMQGDGNPDQTGEISDDPTENISNFIDDFASSKRNWLSRVSGWLLSESREDKIDDFVQEMETNGFWFMDRRETISAALLRNVDFKNTSHCAMKFDATEELTQHRPNCDFRTMTCTNEGCHTKFCAVHVEKHDSVCPYKVIPCEQKCSERILRREMDRHCITVCPMKLVNCPFYQVGCQPAIPLCSIKEHCSETLQSHILSVLQVIHKEGALDQLEQLAQLMEQSEYRDKLSKALDVRSLTLVVKEVQPKIKIPEPVKEPEPEPKEEEPEDELVKEPEQKAEEPEDELVKEPEQKAREPEDELVKESEAVMRKPEDELVKEPEADIEAELIKKPGAEVEKPEDELNQEPEARTKKPEDELIQELEEELKKPADEPEAVLMKIADEPVGEPETEMKEPEDELVDEPEVETKITDNELVKKNPEDELNDEPDVATEKPDDEMVQEPEVKMKKSEDETVKEPEAKMNKPDDELKDGN